MVIYGDWMFNVGKTMSCLSPMAGNGLQTAYKNADDWGDGKHDSQF